MSMLSTCRTQARLILCIALLAAAPAALALETQTQSRSGTYPGRVLDEIGKHKYNLRQTERALREGLELSRPGPLSQDVGDIVVLQDDGSLITGGRTPFDLRGRSLHFVPKSGNGFDLSIDNTAIDTSFGQAQPMKDDASRLFSLPFGFSFYGIRYTSVYLNSDGNLTFGAGDSASSDRSLSRFRTGPPRIAGFFSDLNPEQGGMLFADISAQRALFTWSRVPEYDVGNANTLQVVFYPSGEMRITFDTTMAAQAGIVGISPGSVSAEITLVNYNVELPRSVLSGAIAEQFSMRTLPEIDLAGVALAFYRNHPDDFDSLVVFSVPFVDLGNACAFFLQIKNEIRGLGDIFGDGPGDDLFDYSYEFGSRGRLQGFLNMNMLSLYPDDLAATVGCAPPQAENNTMDFMAQESSHRWGAFLMLNSSAGSSPTALLGRDNAHWSFFMDSDASDLEGNDIRDNGDGTFTTVDVTQRFSQLDQYLMGLRPAAAVQPFFYVQNPTGTFERADSAPRRGVTFRGTRRNVSIDDIVAANGPRVPDASRAAHKFRQAFILLIGKNETPKAADLGKIERIRANWVQFFKAATDNLGDIDTSLRSTAEPVTQVVPFLEGDSSRYTGLAVANRDTIPAKVTVTAYTAAGALLNLPGMVNPASLTLAGGEQRALLDAQLFNLALTADRRGWMRIDSSSDRVSAFYLSGDLNQNYLDGTVATGALHSDMIFTRVLEGPGALLGQDVRTQISLANPGGISTAVTLQYFSSSGRLAATASRTIPALGRLSESLRELFPAATLPLAEGYLRVTATVALSGVEMVRFGDSLFTLPAQPRLTAQKLYSAQFASGGAGLYPQPYFTNLKLVNFNETEARVRIRLVAENGSLLQAPGVSNPLERTLAGGSELAGNASTLFGFPQDSTDPTPRIGSVIIDVLGGGVVGDVLFGDAVAGRTVAGLPLESRLFNGMVFSQVAEGCSDPVCYFTGLAVLNPGDKPVELMISVYDEKGRLSGVNSISVAPGQRLSQTLSQLVPSAAGQQRGYFMVNVLGSTGVAIFELFGDTELKRFLSAVPPQAYDIVR